MQQVPGIEELTALAAQVRRDVLGMIRKAGSGHPGGSLSAVEILVDLFFRQLELRPEDPLWGDRDIFILSKGHACPALYAVMARRGFFPPDELDTLRQPDSRLQGHPDATRLPGLELSAGSLGQGLAVSCGMALGLRLQHSRKLAAGDTESRKRRVYCLLGDGELQEGSVWESAMSASHFRLSGLMAIVDRNMVQLDGDTESVMGLEPLEAKWFSFGWHVIGCDGHDTRALEDAFEEARTWSDSFGGPSVVIARTVKGRGVSFMEGSSGWHGRCPDEEEYERAMGELSDEASG